MLRSNLAKVRKAVRKTEAEAKTLNEAAGGPVTDGVAGWMASQYLAAGREKLMAADGDAQFEVLRLLVQDWAKLRRGDHSAAWVQLERERLEWERTQGKAQKEKEFREWIERPEIRKELFPEHQGGIKPETLAKIRSELNLM